MSDTKKLILIIGATGAQGIFVTNALLAPGPDGSPSPYRVRGLTRNPSSKRAQDLAAKGVELIQGSFEDMECVTRAFEGAWGAFVNTDGFTVGEQREIWAGIKIFEIARRTKSMRHFVWSSIAYMSKLGNWNIDYACEHADAKGRVADYLNSQDSASGENEFSWTTLVTGAYMDMLYSLFQPLNTRADGTVVFAAPIGDGHAPMLSLVDLAWWARYIFDKREETSGKSIEIVSDLVNWDYLVETFTKVTGQPAVYVRQSIEGWWGNFDSKRYNQPLAIDLLGKPEGKGKITAKQNFSRWWRSYRDDIVKPDLAWNKKIHPGTQSLESWMRQNNYTGVTPAGKQWMKNAEQPEGQFMQARVEVITKL